MCEAVAHLYQYTGLMVSQLLLLPWCMAIAYAVIKIISSIIQPSATDKQAVLPVVNLPTRINTITN